jgi:hypothetical protein
MKNLLKEIVDQELKVCNETIKLNELCDEYAKSIAKFKVNEEVKIVPGVFKVRDNSCLLVHSIKYSISKGLYYKIKKKGSSRFERITLKENELVKKTKL